MCARTAVKNVIRFAKKEYLALEFETGCLPCLVYDILALVQVP